jgi:hypothetical protein
VLLQAGKFATVFGNWVDRRDTWSHPFVTAPLPYENVTIVGDRGVVAGPAPFLARRDAADNKPAWLPVIWGPSYATGAGVLGVARDIEYAIELKSAALSSRPEAWEATPFDGTDPTWTARLGWRMDAAWRVGASLSDGPYLLREAAAGLPDGAGVNDFGQTTWGLDARYAHHRLEVWAEVIGSRFEVPNVGEVGTTSYYVELKRKLTVRSYGAVRWGQQFFDRIDDGSGATAAWDRDASRVEVALGYRLTRDLQCKVQVGHTDERGGSPNGDDLLALQCARRW